MPCEMVERKRLLYKSKVEYMAGEGVYCMNHAVGCVHGCDFPCYAFAAAKRRGEVSSMDEWRRVKPVANVQALLESEIKIKRKEPIRRVHMCFTTDPFPYLDELGLRFKNREEGWMDAGLDGWRATLDAGIWVTNDTMTATGILNGAGIPVTVLTKGLLPEVIDLSKCGLSKNGPELMTDWGLITLRARSVHPENEYGITLSSLDEDFRERWEPGAAPYAMRIERLRGLHDAGFKTWVSMKPFPALAGEASPFELVYDALRAVDFADRIVFGRWNYFKDAPCNVPDPDLWYKHAARIARTFCDTHGIECIIKKGTVK